MTSIFINIGNILDKFITSIVDNISFELIYQYAGSTWATVSIDDGINVAGIKAPHKKAEPKAITFTIPLIASLLLTMVLINRAIVREQNVKIKVFIE